jgi:hypothetical protein
MNLTRTLLSLYPSCPADSDWPYTSAGVSAELDCPSDSLVPGATMTRMCGSDGNWQSVDQSECNGPNAQDLAAQMCIQGQ